MKPTDLAAAFEPAYLSLLRRGELSSRIEQAYQHLEDCDLCARYCHMKIHYVEQTDRALFFSAGAACAVSSARTGKSAIKAWVEK